MGWTKLGTPTLTRDSQYKSHGTYSLKCVATSEGEGIVSGVPGEPLNATEGMSGVARIKVVSGTVALDLLLDGSVVAREEIEALTDVYWDRAGLPDMRRHVVESEEGGNGSWAIRIWSLGGAATFYVDGVELSGGVDDETPFVGEGEPRCHAVTPGTYHLTVSFRPPFWLVYISSMNEPYTESYTTRDSETGEVTVSYETSMTIQLRESF